jgi:valyl-tRNA synthetase
LRAAWPVVYDDLVDLDVENEMELLMDVTKAIRHIRSEMNVPPGRKAEVLLVAPDKQTRALVVRNTGYIEGLASAELKILESLPSVPEQAAHAVTRGLEVFVPLKGLIDVDKETARLQKELASVEKDLARVKGKLQNPGFLGKAPADVVEKEKAKEEELSVKASAIRERLNVLVENK